MVTQSHFTNVNNKRLVNTIRKNASPFYQDRVPEATQTQAQDTLDAIMVDERLRNEFVDALVNQIGRIEVRNISWNNPLGIFKTGFLAFGDTIESVQIGLLKAHAYDTAKDYGERDIWGRELPEIQSRFHKINRQEWYKITINDALLRRAFLTDTGLSDFITKLMATPTNSDEVDEFVQMADLFRQYYRRGGFFIKNVADFATDVPKADVDDFLVTVRALTDTVQFPSVNYNSAHMPVFARPEDLVLFITPEAKAKMDVVGLAAAFNIDKAEAHERIITIPAEYVNIPGFQAALVSVDFFVVADTLLENRSADNPAGLYRNYFFHHHQIISMSPFATAVLFSSTDASTAIESFDPVPATAINFVAYTMGHDPTEVQTFERGTMYVTKGTPTPANSTSAFNIGLTADKPIHPLTRVYETGEVFVSPYELNTALSLSYTSQDNASITKVIAIPIAADPAPLEGWPLDRPGTPPAPEPDPDPEA